MFIKHVKEAIRECTIAGEDPFDNFSLSNISEAVGDDVFSNLLKNTANKSMVKAFDTFPATWKSIVNQPLGNRKDFKTNTLIRIDEFTRLEKVKKYTETDMETIGEAAGTYKVETYEKGYQMNRQDIINDDLGAFMKFPQSQGRAAARTIDKFVWDFINNGTSTSLVFDGTALFTSGHGNIITTSPLSTSTLTSARYQLGQMKLNSEDNDDKLGLKPTFLVVPTSLVSLAERIVTAQKGLAQTANNDGNIWKNLIILEVPWLTDAGTEATADWYLMASPSQIDTIQIDFLKGQSIPQTLTRIENSKDNYDFNSNSRAFKTRYEFGGKVVDYRFIIKGDAV